MCGLLPIVLQGLFFIFLRTPPAKEEICEQAVEQKPPDPIQEEPKAVEKNIVSGAKPKRTVSKNIDIPKQRYDNYRAIELSSSILREIDMRAMRTKNKSRMRAYEALGLMEFKKAAESFDKQTEPERSDSPELMFQMDDIN